MSKLSHNAEGTSVNLGPLIAELGPLNNRWRSGSPVEKVLTTWDMGEVLLTHVPNPTDGLLWQIQGMSYMTRNQLRYALVVRRGWDNREELEQLVEGLSNYTVFREALPFLKGQREGLDRKTYLYVVALLREPDATSATRYIKSLKAGKIGRQHKKGASISEIRPLAIAFLNEVDQLEKEMIRGIAPDELSPGVLIAASQLAVAIATSTPNQIPTVLQEVKSQDMKLLAPLIEAIRGGRDAVSAFRRVVSADRLMQTADLLHSMRSKETLEEWRHRRSAKLAISS